MARIRSISSGEKPLSRRQSAPSCCDHPRSSATTGDPSYQRSLQRRRLQRPEVQAAVVVALDGEDVTTVEVVELADALQVFFLAGHASRFARLGKGVLLVDVTARDLR